MACPHEAGHRRPPAFLESFPPCSSSIASGPACINQEHLQTLSSCHGNLGWSRHGVGGQSLSQVWLPFGFGEVVDTGASGKFCSCCVNGKAFCGLRLNATYFFLFAFPHCLLLEPSVHETWLLLGGSQPMCFVLRAVVGQTEKGNSTPGHGAWQVPGRDTWLGSACWPGLFLVCTRRTAGAPVELPARAVQNALDGVVRAALRSPHGHQAPPTGCNINTRASVDQNTFPGSLLCSGCCLVTSKLTDPPRWYHPIV